MTAQAWSRGPDPAPPVYGKAWVILNEDPLEVTAAEINTEMGYHVAEVRGFDQLWVDDKRLDGGTQVVLVLTTTGVRSMLVLDRLEVRGT